jgi:hypothetical protein
MSADRFPSWAEEELELEDVLLRRFHQPEPRTVWCRAERDG